MSADKTQQQQNSAKTTGVVALSSDRRNMLATRRITSDALMAGQRELIIEHSGEEYRLSVTSKGKLILTK